jgi:hypothetical protein
MIPSGNAFIISLGGGFSIDNLPFAGLTGGGIVSGSIGYEWLPWLTTSLSTGWETFEFMNIIPVELKVSGKLLNQKISPYYSVSIGDGTGKENKTFEDTHQYDVMEAGFRFNPAMGICYEDKVRYIFTIGYISQKVRLVDNFQNWNGPFVISEKRVYRRMNLKFTIEF